MTEFYQKLYKCREKRIINTDLYPMKISFKMQGIIMTFSFESKIREFGTRDRLQKNAKRKFSK